MTHFVSKKSMFLKNSKNFDKNQVLKSGTLVPDLGSLYFNLTCKYLELKQECNQNFQNEELILPANSCITAIKQRLKRSCTCYFVLKQRCHEKRLSLCCDAEFRWGNSKFLIEQRKVFNSTSALIWVARIPPDSFACFLRPNCTYSQSNFVITMLSIKPNRGCARIKIMLCVLSERQ